MSDSDQSANDVLVIVPTRSRPDSSIAFAEAFFAHSTRSDLIFALDDDDPTDYPRLNGARYEVNRRLRLVSKLNLVALKYVDQYQYLAFMGDDNRIRTAEWDRLLVEAIEDVPYGIAYGNDLDQGSLLPTSALMKADFVRALGFMGMPALVHLYLDNVWRDLGNALGSLRYRDDVIIEHLHYSIGKSEDDAIYRDSNAPSANERDANAYHQYTRSRLEIDAAKLQLLLMRDNVDVSRELTILNAMYGIEDCGIDVTEHFQELLQDKSFIIKASNDLFGDPCPNRVKRLRFTYQLSGDGRVYTQEVPEHQVVLLPNLVERFSNRGLATSARRRLESSVTAIRSESRDTSMDLPMVSCICPTYNRAPDYLHLVEEAIESFLRQDYSNKELIVLNDTPGQELFCDADRVTIINLATRFRTLGEKLNAAVALSQGDLIAPWDDDDISLPWRLSYSVNRLGDADYFNPRGYWFRPPDGLRYDHHIGYSHNASIFTRAAFLSVGGYPSISNGYDRDIDSALLSKVESYVDPWTNDSSPPLTKDEWFYIYRWGVSPGHVSGSGGDEHGGYMAIGERAIEPGYFELRPQWRVDYETESRRVLEDIKAAGNSI